MCRYLWQSRTFLRCNDSSGGRATLLMRETRRPCWIVPKSRLSPGPSRSSRLVLFEANHCRNMALALRMKYTRCTSIDCQAKPGTPFVLGDEIVLVNTVREREREPRTSTADNFYRITVDLTTSLS